MSSIHGTTPRGRDPLPVLSVGFRPFYLAASAFAVLAMPLWLAVLHGAVTFQGYLYSVTWHAHEMLFGFAVAVMAGFLLTAVRNWSGHSTPVGGPLAALVTLWLLGRVLVVAGPPVVAAIVDVAFLPLLLASLAPALWRSGRPGNLFLVAAVLGLLTGANAVFHLARHGLLAPQLDLLSLRTALDVIAVLMTVIGGRVIPSFIANAVPGARVRRVGALDALCVGSMVLVAVLGVVDAWVRVPGTLWVVLLGAATMAHLVRIALWKPGVSRREPLLWILPLSYAWIPVALALRALSHLTGDVPVVLADHALAVGAMSGLMLGMMTRSALGHTGRALTAGPSELAAYLLVHAAALLRVVPPLIWPGFHAITLTASAACWTAAFGFYLARYAGILTLKRKD